ncbi:inositol monophosphatase [Labedella endophytica]|uniref:Inositol monophosphatase n=2 Tax=Labedella endophytica TaxID=1523160 RepID=A0A433JV60_9MICO|nr:inositol monophosphatase [Labedella endophytica]
MRLEGIAAERKSSAADLVTAADRAAEDLVRSMLQNARPQDGLTGEEGAASPSSNGRRWVVDPVDGTFNFVSGLTGWCSAVALEVDGDVAVGAVRRVVPDETWVAAGGRTELNGRPVSRLRDRALEECSVATYLDAADLGDRSRLSVMSSVISGAATVRINGSGSCDLADVAAGRIGLWIQADCAEWDWLPGRALVEGAGGAAVVVERAGHRWHLAGSRRAVAEAVVLVNAV